MALQYIRKWTLLASESTGDGLDLSGLRCTFKVSKKDTQTPNEAEFTIYNVGRDAMAKLKKSFVKVIASAGYESNFGLVFSGNIKGFEQSKEGTETVLKLTAGDGDKEYNYTVINKTIAAGADASTIIGELTTAMNVPIEHTPDFNAPSLPRGKVLYGRPHEFMREQADNTGCTWSIQDGKVLVLKRTEVLNGNAVLLNSKSGLIGIPKQTEDGIEGVCLLNPMLKIGAKLKIESEFAPDITGEYRIISISHYGDTHANDWYSGFTALALNQTGGDSPVSNK